MTWTAALLPDDALDPDSLVGRMLNPEAKPIQWPEVKWQASPLAAEQAPQVFDVTLPPPATVDTLSLWWAMDLDRWPETYQVIEAVRDWLLPEETEPSFADNAAEWFGWHERQRLRSLLTKQARIARGKHD
tara:strand:- start:462 stop:854 length:393 start_codon:yes stop_codon:yes gene_type:complete